LLQQINSYVLRHYNALNCLNNAHAFAVIISSYIVPYELTKTHPYGEGLITHPYGEALITHPYGKALLEPFVLVT